MKPRVASVIGIIVIVLLLVGLWGVVEAQPLRPGGFGYGVQQALTDFSTSLIYSPVRRANRLISLAQIRLRDYQVLDGTAREHPALLELDSALRRAAIDVQEVDPARQASLIPSLEDTARAVIQNVGDHGATDPVVIAMEDAVRQRAQSILDGNLAVAQALAGNPPGHVLNTPLNVPFPLGSLQGHPFPLDGAHASVPCEGCHVGGSFSQLVANTCTDCHEDPHGPNYGPTCETCHNTTAWVPVSVDHTQLTDCASCHQPDAPANHYEGQCSACHNTTDWAQVSFDHTGLTDCASCHQADAPSGHYQGQCSTCHTTTVWTDVVFDHTGFTDCASCHQSDAPVNHYPGQCSACHTTQSWQGAVFNHAGFTDCASCHQSNAPANHYPGQCSACHTTQSWQGAVFNHTGFTDCIGCHASTAPPNHFSGQCSQCHSTQSWQNASFDHSFPMTHGGASGCATCHTGNDYNSYTCYGSGCHNQTEIVNHHAEEGIVNLANCVQCHPGGRGGEGGGD